MSKKGKGNLDCYVSVFNSETMTLEYASLFGGSDQDRVMSANFINKDTIVIGGLTNLLICHLLKMPYIRSILCVRRRLTPSFLGLRKSFVSVIDIKKSKLLYSSYFGCSHLLDLPE